MKSKIVKALNDQSELIQNDLECILDGLDDYAIENACQVIVDHMSILRTQIKSIMKNIE